MNFLFQSYPAEPRHDALFPNLFEPVALHLESTNFSLRSIWCAVRCNRFRAVFAFNQRPAPGLLRAPLLTHLHRKGPELLRYWANCLHSTHRLKTHLGSRFRQVCVALHRFTHGFPASLDRVPPKRLSQIRGHCFLAKHIELSTLAIFESLLTVKTFVGI